MRIKVLVLFATSLLWPLATLAQVPVERPDRVAPRARQAVPVAHPLDPLTAREITVAVQALRAHPQVPAGSLFPSIALSEPPKQYVRDYRSGTPVRREAFALVFDRPGNRTFEAIVDLGTRAVTSMKQIEGAQPAITFEELDRVPALVRADAAWQAAMRSRDITNFAEVHVDPWAPGLLDPKTEPRTIRWARALSYLKGRQKNVYARPIEGVVAIVNLTTMAVERVIDTGALPLPPQTADLDERSIGRQRVAPKPLRAVQPLGPSFEVRGQEVRWQKWRFRFSIHPREGLVLHTVGIRRRRTRAAHSLSGLPLGDAGAVRRSGVELELP